MSNSHHTYTGIHRFKTAVGVFFDITKKLRKAIKFKKVSASHIKNNVIVITELELSEEDFKKILDPTGYRITSYNKSVSVKKFFGWR